MYGEELVELVALPVLGACALDAECAVRAGAARGLAELALLQDSCTDLVDLLEKILNRPFEAHAGADAAEAPIPPDADTADLRLAAAALLDLLHGKLLAAPGAHAARCCLVLLDHLDCHYKRPALFMHHPDIRLKVLSNSLST